MRNGCLQPSCSQADCGWGAGALHHGKTAYVNFDAEFDVDVDVDSRVAEVARRHEGPPPKSLDLDENLSTFWEYLGKKSVFWVKNSVFRQEVHYYMVYIAFLNELNLQICDYAQKRRICRENCKYALDENFRGNFCPRRKAAKFCHPA